MSFEDVKRIGDIIKHAEKIKTIFIGAGQTEVDLTESSLLVSTAVASVAPFNTKAFTFKRRITSSPLTYETLKIFIFERPNGSYAVEWYVDTPNANGDVLGNVFLGLKYYTDLYDDPDLVDTTVTRASTLPQMIDELIEFKVSPTAQEWVYTNGDLHYSRAEVSVAPINTLAFSVKFPTAPVGTFPQVYNDVSLFVFRRADKSNSFEVYPHNNANLADFDSVSAAYGATFPIWDAMVNS